VVGQKALNRRVPRFFGLSSVRKEHADEPHERVRDEAEGDASCEEAQYKVANVDGTCAFLKELDAQKIEFRVTEGLFNLRDEWWTRNA
jgi:hypothetical protein